MNTSLSYTFIKTLSLGQEQLQTLGLVHSLGIELCMQLVIPESLTRGMIAQIATYCTHQLEHPSLFNDLWLEHAFEENHSLCLLPFCLLKNDGFVHIIVPDLDGHYPWHEQCAAPFSHQTDPSLLLVNLLGRIKASFLSHLMLDVALEVYQKIDCSFQLDDTLSLDELPDHLAGLNLDMYIALMVCFNQTISSINHYILSACESISLILTQIDDPLAKAAEIAFQIYDPTLKETYVTLTMQTFHKLTSHL